MIYDNNDATL